MKRMHVISVCLLVFLFFAGCQTLGGASESADIARAWRQHRRGNYKFAMWDFEHALKHNPQSAEAYFGLAVIYEDLGDYSKTKQHFLKAVELDPRYSFLYYDVGSNKLESADIRRGWRERARNNYDQAITTFKLALEKTPQSAEAYIGLGNIYEDKKDYNQALKYYSKAIEIKPKSGYFWLRGDVWRRRNDCERAIEDYTSAITKDPSFAAAHTDRGFCYMSMGKYETALADYKKALELVPSNDQRPYAIRVRTIALKAISDIQKKTLK